MRFKALLIARSAIASLALVISGVAPGAAQDAGGFKDLASLKAAYKRPALIPFPPGNPYTPEKAALGKALFFEPRLSGAENMACATCHNPSFGWEGASKTAVGAQNTRLGRQAPTVLNTAWIHIFFWDGRADSAEAQAKGPIEAPGEMNMPMGDGVQRLSAIPAYKEWFERIFPGEGVSSDSITKAIATFERTVTASYAPFDAWIDGDETAIPDSAKRGFKLFVGQAKCAGCHVGWNFTDNKFHDIGTTVTDIGRAKFDPDNPEAMYAFKTPTLRDTAQRAPYMHNGEFATLDHVMRHYMVGGIERPSRSPLMQPIDLSEAEIADIITFMKSLTGSKQVVTLPILPN
jgi:cytochrome c peroxidase